MLVDVLKRFAWPFWYSASLTANNALKVDSGTGTLNSLAGAVLLVVGAGAVLPTPAGAQPVGKNPLPAEEQKRVNEALDRGVTYLRRTQLASGSWSNGSLSQRTAPGSDPRVWAVAYAALPALAMLECGADPTDPAIQKAARFVRHYVRTQTRTYEVSLAFLLLDRLGEPGDRPLIRSLALRLVAGQNAYGGWGYSCPLTQAAQEKKLLALLRRQKSAPL
jgi:hypothetical protein